MNQSEFNHKLYLHNQSRLKSIERKELIKDNRIERYCDYTSHNLKEFVESSDYIF